MAEKSVTSVINQRALLHSFADRFLYNPGRPKSKGSEQLSKCKVVLKSISKLFNYFVAGRITGCKLKSDRLFV